MQNNLIQIETQITELSSNLNNLKGQYSLLQEQIAQSTKKIIDYKQKKELYVKSVELLNYVSEVTKIKTKEGFEKIVTYALHYIYGSGYEFKLSFGRRGNLSELKFLLKTPNCEEPLDLLDSSGGGVLDVVSLAIRVVLLQLTHQNTKTYLLLDEPFKHLSVEYLSKAENFLHVINKKLNKQIILITHKQEFLTSENTQEFQNSENNVIRIGE